MGKQGLQLKNVKDLLYCYVKYDNNNKGYLDYNDINLI